MSLFLCLILIGWTRDSGELAKQGCGTTWLFLRLFPGTTTETMRLFQSPLQLTLHYQSALPFQPETQPKDSPEDSDAVSNTWHKLTLPSGPDAATRWCSSTLLNDAASRRACSSDDDCLPVLFGPPVGRSNDKSLVLPSQNVTVTVTVTITVT